MAKYSLEFKIKLIEEYKKGKNSITNIAKTNNITYSIFHEWINLYDKKGIEGLKRSRNKTTYNQDFKIKVVKEYLTTNTSYSDLAIKYGISSFSLITRWKLDYEKSGIMGLQDKKKGRPTLMLSNKPKKDNRMHQEKMDDKQKIKDLEMQLEIARAENALLKKYQALGIPIPESMLKRK